jgi:hypothetical protein
MLELLYFQKAIFFRKACDEEALFPQGFLVERPPHAPRKSEHPQLGAAEQMKNSVLRYVFLYLLHVRSNLWRFRSKTPSYAQNSLAALKLPLVSLKISFFRSNYLF